MQEILEFSVETIYFKLSHFYLKLSCILQQIKHFRPAWQLQYNIKFRKIPTEIAISIINCYFYNTIYLVTNQLLITDWSYNPPPFQPMTSLADNKLGAVDYASLMKLLKADTMTSTPSKTSPKMADSTTMG